jgi:hypothetical protein
MGRLFAMLGRVARAVESSQKARGSDNGMVREDGPELLCYEIGI